MNARWKPSVRATGIGSPPATRSPVRLLAIEARIARPSAPPICCDVLIRPGGQAGLVVLDARHRGDRHRHEREAEADRGQQRREQDVGHVVAVRRDLREPDQPARGQQQAGDQHRLEAEAGRQPGGQAGRDDDAAGQRQVGEPGLERVVAEHLLHVQRDEEEHREQRRRDEQRRQVDAGDRPVPEDARERDERRAAASARSPRTRAISASDRAIRPSVRVEPQPSLGASTSA